MAKNTHAVMSSSLAKALIESGVKHYDSGGLISALTPQSDFQAQGGDYVGNMNTAVGNDFAVQKKQNELADQLLKQSQGYGPNPAQSQFMQNADMVAKQQAGAIASQKGINPALAVRLAAGQGAQQAQAAAGSAATLQAQQQIQAQQQLGQQQANIAAENQALYGDAIKGQSAENTVNSGTDLANAAAQQKTLGGIAGGIGSVLGFLNKGGKVPDHLHKVASIYHPTFAQAAHDFRSGGPVAGKAVVQGNSIKNDVVPAMLSPGEDVLPRSVTQAADAPRRASDFVRHLQEKQSGAAKEKKLLPEHPRSKRSLKDRVERLEKMYQGGAA